MSRPSTYTEKIVAAICERLAIGESVRTICKSDDMPSAASVFKWLSQHSDFAEQYARAKEAGCAVLAEELLDIADDGSNDWMESNDPDNPGYDLNKEHIQRSKLRVDTRKWYLSKIVPKVYGDKQQIEHSGHIELGKMSDAELDAELAQLAAIEASGAAHTPVDDDGSDLI